MAENTPAARPSNLSRKAEVFAYDMKARFVFDGQLPPKRRVPTPQHPYATYNMPDNAYMTGMYVGMLALQYGQTGDPAVRGEAAVALEALNLLCIVSGVPGVLARAAVRLDMPFHDDGTWIASPDGRHKWRNDVSSDQVDGVLFGYALAYDLLADGLQKEMIARNTACLVGSILDHGMKIVDYDGKPTRWGSYDPEYCRRREKMNALLLLQHLKVAHHVTGQDRFVREYERVARELGYAAISVEARRMGDPFKTRVNHSDDVLLWLAYYPLLKYETAPDLRDYYLAGLKRAWKGADGHPGIDWEGNPLYGFLVAKELGDSSGVAPAVETLKLFPLDMKFNRDTLAAYEKQFGFSFDPTPVSPPPGRRQVVPIDRRPKDWSAWVAEPFREGDREADGDMEFTGLDYLLAYWLGRSTGCISADQ